MAGIIFKLTDAGRQALVNAQQNGTQARTLVSVGVTAVAFTPTPLLSAVPNELKRLAAIAGDVVAKDTIHVTIRDDGTGTYSVRGLGLYIDNGVLLGTYSQPAVIVEKSANSILLLATDLRVMDGGVDISTLNFGETNFINPPATTERQGVVELATLPETATGTDAVRAVTPAGIKPLLDGKQPLDATLTALAGVATAADRLIYATGADKFAVTPLTAFIRTLLDDADAAAARNTLGAAPLASPGLTGIPTAPTAAVGTSTTQLATTAFVIGQAGTAAPKMDAAATVGTATSFAREDHVHPIDTSRAPLASPDLTGTPTAPTAAVGTSTTQLATTAFVIGQAGTAAPKMDAAATVGTATRFAREDHVHPTDTSRAPLASPGLTGTPTAPTAADGTSTTQLATTAFVQNAVGGYLAKAVTGGTVTLTEAEASNPVIALTGALTSALNLVVPVTVKRIWAIYNSTTGAFGVTVKTAAGTGVAVAQGKRNLVYTDGTNVYDGFNDFDNIAITGTSTAPTAAVGTNTTQLATTEFVIGQAGTAAPKIDGAAAVGTATRFAREDHVHPTDTSRAPLASPGLTGTPTAPTAAVGTSTTQLATTAFVIGQAGTAAPKMDAAATVGTATRFAREDHVHPTDTSRAPLASPGLTGTPTAPTAADGTSTTQLATTAFVQNAVGGYLAKAVTGGTVTLTEAEASNPVIALTGALTSALNLVVPVTVKRIWAIYNSTTGAFGVTVKTAAGTGVAVAQGKRNLVYTDGTNVYDGFNDFDNIAITGTSTAPTAAVGTNTTQLATTEFVIGQAGTAAPKIDGAAAVGTATRFAREDHVHPTDTSRAPLASPGLTGTPTAPTAAVGTSTTQLATTAFVIGQAGTAAPKIDGAAAVGTATRFAREDHVHPTDTSRAPLASPGLTGTPTAPTAADGTSTTQLATTAFVQNAVGGYLAKAVTGGTVTLTAAEASNPMIALTGALTSDLWLVVPATVKRIWGIFNSTTGAFGVTVKTAAGTGVAVAQGKRNLVYTDGTNVYDGFNDFDNIAITGTSTAPTAAVGTNTTQLATTEFVIGQAGTAAPKIDGAAAVGTATRFAREDHVHPTDTSRAPLASPGLTGTPTAPTAAVGTSTTQLATTAFVIGQAGTAAPKMDAVVAVGTATRFAREDHVHPTDTSRAPLASPGLTGTPTAPTAADGTSTTQLATTAFVQSAVGGYLAKGVTGGTVTLTEAEASNPVIALTGALTSALNLVVPVTVKRIWAIYNSTTGAFGVTVKTAAGTGVAVAQGKRNLVYTDGTNVYDGFNDFDNIAITGASTAPTAAVGTNTTQLATTAFVIGQAGTAAPKIDGAAAVGTATRFAREDHVHPTDTSRAPLASPGLTGTPTAPTAAAGTNTTQIATTAFVVARTQTASETVSGVSEIATQAETNTGTDDVRTVTPLKLKAWKAATSGVQIFESNGSFTVPVGVTKLIISAIAGGGGGGGGTSDDIYTGGGGGGGSGNWLIQNQFNVTPGQVLAIVVGAGGAGATATARPSTTANFGGSGGATTIAALGVNLVGGTGGGGAKMTDWGNMGGPGTGGNGGNAGGLGGGSTKTAFSPAPGGNGGDGIFGPGGRTTHWGWGGTGNQGPSYGSGGSGGQGSADGFPNSTGGRGSNGVVIIEW